MHCLSARIDEQRRDVGDQVVRSFMGAFTNGQGESASSCIGPAFVWFGRQVGRAGWNSEAFQRFCSAMPMVAQNIRPLAPEIRELLSQAGLARVVGLDGDGSGGDSLSTADPIFLVDVSRGGRTSTVGLLVGFSGASDPWVAAVFDAEPLQGLILNACARLPYRM